jgi:Fe-S-cluster containining protein
LSDVALPPLYQGWITRVLGEAPPVERRATCLDCVQCAPDRPAEVAFNPDTKCCTYVPHLPNFLVGRLLEDGDPRLAFGVETLRVRLRRGVGVNPLGLLIHPEESAAYERIVKSEGFGRSAELRCPHYISEGGLCGIWLHRNAICSTWYCRHDDGDRGFQFWHAVETLLRAVETELSRAAALRIRFGPKATAMDAGERAKALESLDNGDFGGWVSDIEKYYIMCAEWARCLSWPAVVALAPEVLEPLVAAVQTTHRRLKVPAVLPDENAIFAPARIIEVGSDHWVSGYHRHAAVKLTGAQFDLLLAFRQGTVVDLMAKAGATGVSVTPPMVERLRLEDVLVQPAADLDEDEDEAEPS